ncbi:MAG TPA: DinB family protein [Anaerolineae bacterium]|jgi:hypothetical protein
MTLQHQFTPEQRAEMIAQIRQLPELLANAVHGLTPAQLTTHFLPNEWSVAQNVHHVADAHVNVFFRMKQMLTTDQPQIQRVDQDAWAALPDADNADIETSLTLLRGLHARWAMLLESLTPEQWLRAVIRNNGMASTMEDQLRIYSGHGEAHIQQISKTLAAK